MKAYNYTIFCLLALLVAGCTDANNTAETLPIDTANNVLLLKVDYETTTFEGGTELTFESDAPLTITHNYQAPGDFGGIQLYHENLEAMLFDGSIIWMGVGERTYPETLLPATSFATGSAMTMPAETNFEPVLYTEGLETILTTEYAAIWEAIANVTIVNTYRTANPDASIYVFLYTPSVGVGDSADWDWYVYMQG